MNFLGKVGIVVLLGLALHAVAGTDEGFYRLLILSVWVNSAWDRFSVQ